jgi:hypothetical protein
VQARNSVGISLPSAVLTILAAQKPIAPVNVRTIIEGSNVRISWDAADDGNTDILSYLI